MSLVTKDNERGIGVEPVNSVVLEGLTGRQYKKLGITLLAIIAASCSSAPRTTNAMEPDRELGISNSPAELVTQTPAAHYGVDYSNKNLMPVVGIQVPTGSALETVVAIETRGIPGLPTATPESTKTPEPSVTPFPTETVAPTETDLPTNTPTLEVTATDVPTDTAVVVASPTDVPQPTEIATATDIPTVVLEPTVVSTSTPDIPPTVVSPDAKFEAIANSVEMRFANPDDAAKVRKAIVEIGKKGPHKDWVVDDFDPEFQAKWAENFPTIPLEIAVKTINEDVMKLLVGKDSATGVKWVSYIGDRVTCSATCFSIDSSKGINFIEIDRSYLDGANMKKPEIGLESAIQKETQAFPIVFGLWRHNSTLSAEQLGRAADTLGLMQSYYYILNYSPEDTEAANFLRQRALEGGSLASN